MILYFPVVSFSQVISLRGIMIPWYRGETLWTKLSFCFGDSLWTKLSFCFSPRSVDRQLCFFLPSELPM